MDRSMENPASGGKDGRIVYIDVLKGVAVFFVVLGHIVAKEKDFNRLYNFIYSFHMPLFMFLAGCTTVISYSRKHNSDVAYLGKRFVNIMVPYFVWAVILPVFSDRSFVKVDWRSVLEKTFVTNRMFWFLPTLYVLIVGYIVYRRIGEWLCHSQERIRENEKLRTLVDLLSCSIVVGIYLALMLLTKYQLFRDVIGFVIPYFAAVFYMEHDWVGQLIRSRFVVAAASVIFVLLIGNFDFDRVCVATSLLRMLLGMCAVVVLIRIFTKFAITKNITGQLVIWGQWSLLIYVLHTELTGLIRYMFERGENGMWFGGREGYLLWYCLVSVVVCYACSLLAVILQHIPIVRTALMGKIGDSYAEK